MWVDGIKWNSIRIRATRISPHTWTIFRDGAEVGEVWCTRDGEWRSSRPKRSFSRHSSFRTAVLGLTRTQHVWVNPDGPQDYGDVRMIRIQCATTWYTVIFHKGKPFVFDDFSVVDKDMQVSPQHQPILQKVVNEAHRWAKKNL